MEPQDRSRFMSQPREFMGQAREISPTFFGKVMSVFGLAILSSAAGVYLSFRFFLEGFIENPALMWIVFIGELALIFTSGLWSTKRPLNYILFVLFAVLTGIAVTPLLMVATITAGTGIVIKALFSTFLMFTAAGVIGYTTKRSLEGMRGFLLVTLIGMVIVSIIGIFIPWGTTFEYVYTIIGIVLFSAFAMYDFQKIKSFPEDRYIDAALHLYLDIFNLFIFILRLLMNQER